MLVDEAGELLAVGLDGTVAVEVGVRAVTPGVLRSEVQLRRAEAVRRPAGLPGAVDTVQLRRRGCRGRLGCGLRRRLGGGAGLRRGRGLGRCRCRSSVLGLRAPRAWGASPSCDGLGLRGRRGRRRRNREDAGLVAVLERQHQLHVVVGVVVAEGRAGRALPGWPGCRRRRRGRPPSPGRCRRCRRGCSLPSPSPSRATECQVSGRNCIWPTARSHFLSRSRTPLSLSAIAANAPGAVELRAADLGAGDAVGAELGTAEAAVVRLDATDGGEQGPRDLAARVRLRHHLLGVVVGAQGGLGHVVAAGAADREELGVAARSRASPCAWRGRAGPARRARAASPVSSQKRPKEAAPGEESAADSACELTVATRSGCCPESAESTRGEAPRPTRVRTRGLTSTQTYFISGDLAWGAGEQLPA